MSREIKFRCFVPDEGDYYYIEKGHEYWLQFIDDKQILFIEDEKWESGSGEWVSYPCVREVESFTTEQFTGLLDKNGKEIFEGDKLRYILGRTPEIDTVKYSDIYAHFFCGNAFLGTTEVEIIGNIHENGDLIK